MTFFCIIDIPVAGFVLSNRGKIDTLKCTDIFYTFSIKVSRSIKLWEFNIILYLTYLLIYLLTPWSRVLLAKLTSKLSS